MKRTNKMADALCKAVHEAIDNGVNTGRLGRIVLTHEASQRLRSEAIKGGWRPQPSVPRQQRGSVDGEGIFIIVICVLGIILLASPLVG